MVVDVRVLAPDLDVLLHDPPALLGGQRVPGARLHERVDEQVLAAERAREPGASRRSTPRPCASQERVGLSCTTSSGRSGPARRGTRGCGRGSPPRRRASGRSRRACRSVRSSAAGDRRRSPRRRRELALVLGALGRRQPAPGRIDLQEGVFHEVALGHARQRIVAALLAARRAPAARARGGHRAEAAAPAQRTVARVPPLRHDARPTTSQRSIRRDFGSASLGATQGGYDQTQALLDISAGARDSSAAYKPTRAPPLGFYADGTRVPGLARRARPRRRRRPRPSCPGCSRRRSPARRVRRRQRRVDRSQSIAVADRRGRVAGMASMASPATSSRGRAALLRRQRVVAGAARRRGDAARSGAIGRRGRARGRADEPPPARVPQLLPVGLVGGRPGRTLTSRRRALEGIVAGIDLAPTVLEWLGMPVPGEMKGQPIRRAGPRRRRAARPPAPGCGSSTSGATRRSATWRSPGWSWPGSRVAAGRRRGWRGAVRLGALAVLWLLPVLLLFARAAARRA